MNSYNKKDIPDHLLQYFEPCELGLENTPEEYVEKMVGIFKEIKRVLKKEGTVWLNLGDSYYGGGWKGSKTDLSNTKQGTNKGTECGKDLKPDGKHEFLKSKDLVGIPWRVAFALQQDGWYLRQDIIWQKPNPMPESVNDRCTKSHEYIFLLSKSPKYYFDSFAIKEPANYDGRKDTTHKGSDKYKDNAYLNNQSAQSLSTKERERWPIKIDGIPMKNKRSVWKVNVNSYKEAHFATYPKELIEPCIKAGVPEKGIVLDPFMGSGTTAEVALRNNRDYVGIELNPDYIKIIEKRLDKLPSYMTGKSILRRKN